MVDRIFLPDANIAANAAFGLRTLRRNIISLKATGITYGCAIYHHAIAGAGKNKAAGMIRVFSAVSRGNNLVSADIFTETILNTRAIAFKQANAIAVIVFKLAVDKLKIDGVLYIHCLLYTSPSPRD